MKKMPKKASRLRRKFTLSAEPVARRITLRNHVGKAQVRISSLNVRSLKSYRTTVRTPKHRNCNITQSRLTPSLHPRKTTKKLASSRLQHNDLVSVRHLVRSDPPTKGFHEYQQHMMGILLLSGSNKWKALPS